MFCQYCGKQLDDAAQFCSACGRPLSASAPAAAVETATEKMNTHLQVLAVCWAVYSAFHIVMGVWTLAFSHYFVPMLSNFVPRDVNALPIAELLHAVYAATFVYSVAAGIIGFVTAWGLWQRKRWARVLALVVAFLSLINIPFGTAVGVYTLIALLPSEAGQTYGRMAVA
ncbi:MAG: DUF2127 domain-containing protein [Candidatus Acidiferrales bacterium]